MLQKAKGNQTPLSTEVKHNSPAASLTFLPYARESRSQNQWENRYDVEKPLGNVGHSLEVDIEIKMKVTYGVLVKNSFSK